MIIRSLQFYSWVAGDPTPSLIPTTPISTSRANPIAVYTHLRSEPETAARASIGAPPKQPTTRQQRQRRDTGLTDDVGADGDGDDGLGGAEGGGVRLHRAGRGAAAAAGVAQVQVLHRRPLHRSAGSGLLRHQGLVCGCHPEPNLPGRGGSSLPPAPASDRPPPCCRSSILLRSKAAPLAICACFGGAGLGGSMGSGRVCGRKTAPTGKWSGNIQSSIWAVGSGSSGLDHVLPARFAKAPCGQYIAKLDSEKRKKSARTRMPKQRT